MIWMVMSWSMLNPPVKYLKYFRHLNLFAFTLIALSACSSSEDQFSITKLSEADISNEVELSSQSGETPSENCVCLMRKMQVNGFRSIQLR